jgi:hypothetical protein
MGLGLLDARDFLSSIYSCNRVQLDLAQTPRGYPAVGLAFVIAAAGWMASGAIGAHADLAAGVGFAYIGPSQFADRFRLNPLLPNATWSGSVNPALFVAS